MKRSSLNQPTFNYLIIYPICLLRCKLVGFLLSWSQSICIVWDTVESYHLSTILYINTELSIMKHQHYLNHVNWGLHCMLQMVFFYIPVSSSSKVISTWDLIITYAVIWLECFLLASQNSYLWSSRSSTSTSKHQEQSIINNKLTTRWFFRFTKF